MPVSKSFIRFLLIISVLLLVMLACGNPKPADISLEITSENPPGNLTVGDTFTFKLILANRGLYNVEISQVRLPVDLLNATSLRIVSPSMTEGTGDNSTRGFNLDAPLTIAPNGRETFTFTFDANTRGSFTGNGSVITNGDPVSFETRIVIIDQAVGGSTPAPSSSQTPIPLGAIPYQAVVQISAMVEIDGSDLIGWTGSGTIITPDGLILTNAHVVLSDRFYAVKDLIVSLTVAQDSPPVQTYLASVVQADARLDLAVIKVRSDMNGNPIDSASLNLPSVPLGNSDSLSLGDPIVIIGYPGIGGDTVTLTRGEVSGFTAEEPYGNRAYVKTSGTIAGGNSGGLAANSVGELIGIPTRVGAGDENITIVDCRRLVDTNRDGAIDEFDNCVPTGGFINAMRPIKLALSMIESAKHGEVAVEAGTSSGQEYEAEGTILFDDDFSDPASGWSTNSDSYGTTAFQNGEMTVEVKTTNYVIWSEINTDYDDVIMVADVRVINSVGNGDFGFTCGIQDNENFTVLEISEDGYFTFWKYQSNEFISLIDWTYTDEVAMGSPFVLAALCGTSNLALVVNGGLLAEYFDPDFTPGKIGLLAGTYETSGFKVGFDNFTLMLP